MEARYDHITFTCKKNSLSINLTKQSFRVLFSGLFFTKGVEENTFSTLAVVGLTKN
jgi:hypothetical protein